MWDIHGEEGEWHVGYTWGGYACVIYLGRRGLVCGIYMGRRDRYVGYTLGGGIGMRDIHWEEG